MGRSGPHIMLFLGPAMRPNPKRHLDWFSRFCTAHGMTSLHFTMSRPLLTKLPVPWGSGPQPNDSLGTSEPTPKQHLDWISRFWYGGRPQPRRLCVRCGPSPLPRKGRSPPNFRPASIVAKRLHGSRCHLVRR